MVTTVAGTGVEGFVDGPAQTATFSGPAGVAVDRTCDPACGSATGIVYVADTYNNRIRRVDTLKSEVTTYGPSDVFFRPQSVAVDNSGVVYVADTGNQCIRAIDPGTRAVTTVAGLCDKKYGFRDGATNTAMFNAPRGVAVNFSGDAIYVADAGNNRIRQILRSKDGSYATDTLAGSGVIGFADGQGLAATFDYPSALAFDVNRLIVSDTSNTRIRTVSLDEGTTPRGSVNTLAGSTPGYLNGAAASAQFTEPLGVSVDANGIIYVADWGRIRTIDTSGIVATFAGSGEQGFSDGPVNSAIFNQPMGVTVDYNGTVYVGDYGNQRIRRLK